MVTSRSPDRAGGELERGYLAVSARVPPPPPRAPAPPVPLVGDRTPVPCVDGTERPYLSFDAAASSGALSQVLAAVEAFVPWYSSVHRGAGYKSQLATAAYEDARAAALGFARPGRRASGEDVAIICRNTTEALNHLAYRLRLSREDVVVTTVVEHHANLLPWSRAATCRYVECGPDGTFSLGAVEAALDERPAPRLLAVTGASNITGWLPDISQIIAAAHQRGVPVVVDAAQLAPHRPLPADADFLAWSGHKMYAPFGAGILVGPREQFTEGDPFLAGGGAVDLVDLDEVVWTCPPDREEAGSPNVIGAVALHAAIQALGKIGWPALVGHDRGPSARAGPGRGDPAGCRVHRAGCPARTRGRAAGRRGGHRRAAWLLLRPPLPDAAAQPRPRRDPSVPGPGQAGRPQRHARGGARQRRHQHHRRRRAAPARRRGTRRRRAPSNSLPPRSAHRRLPPEHRRAHVAATAACRSPVLLAGLGERNELASEGFAGSRGVRAP